MSNEWQIIQFLVQGGAVSISLALIWYLNENSKRHKTTIENHLSSSVKAMKDNTKINVTIAKSLQRMCDLLQRLAEKIK